MTGKAEARRKQRQEFPSVALREVERLWKIDDLLETADAALDRRDPDDINLSLVQARAGVAEARKWIDDAVACLKIGAGIPLDG